MDRRPNLVFLLNDHQAYYRHGWDGGPKVARPNFDRLAAEGVVFNRAYSACPLCGPARRSMLTGLFPHNHGELKNDSNHLYDRETYLDILAQQGYRNYYYGKWHAGAGTAHDHHCEGFSYPSYSNPYTKPEYAEYLKRRNLPEPEIDIEKVFVRWQFPLEEGKPYKQQGRWGNEHASGIMTTPADTHESFFLANLACDRLRELAREKDAAPFALRVDFWGPHQPYFPTREFADMYDPASIPEYPSFRDDLNGKPARYRFDSNLIISDENRELIHPNPLPWSEWLKVVARCYAQVTQVDAAGGRVLDALDGLGLTENTLVIWTTDHGDALACHGGHFDKASYLPEEMMRIPMALRFPSRVRAGQKREDLASNMDVPVTLLDAAGTRFSQRVDGQSLLPLCAGETKKWREDLMCETHGHQQNVLGRVLVTDRHKYVWNDGDLDELYDLSNDPYEMANLAASPAHKKVVDDMKARLARWQRETGDDPDSPSSYWRRHLAAAEAKASAAAATGPKAK